MKQMAIITDQFKLTIEAIALSTLIVSCGAINFLSRQMLQL
jgi:hypothetical protein